MEIDINNLTAYQEDHRIEAKDLPLETDLPTSVWTIWT